MKDLAVNEKLTYKKAEVLKTLNKISAKFFNTKNREDARAQWVDDITKILMNMFRGLSQGVCKERSWANELEAGRAFWGNRTFPEKRKIDANATDSQASGLQEDEEAEKEEQEEEEHEND